MDKNVIAFIRKHGRIPKDRELRALPGKISNYYRDMGGQIDFLKALKKEHPDLYKEVTVDRVTQHIIATYILQVKELGRHPIAAEMNRAGVHATCIQLRFGNMRGLTTYMLSHHSDAFDHLFTDSEFTPERFNKTLKTISKYKRFVITTALAGGKVDRKFLASVKSYCLEKKALLLIIPIADPVSNRSSASMGMAFDPVYDDIKLNDNFYISGLRLQAKHINPYTGLQRIARKTGNFVYGSPKQSLEYVASETYPTALMTTGALTYSDYSTELYVSQRTAYIADKDHLMGALVVEIADTKRFYFRQLQSNVSGEFVDLAVLYSGDKRRPVKSLFSFPDLHSYGRDKKLVSEVWSDVVKTLGCVSLAIHDAFDGQSCNHHIKAKHYTRHKTHVSVSDELDELAQTLKEVEKWGAEINIVKSNHDDFLDQWIDAGDYVKEPINAKIGHRAWLVKDSGMDLLKWALEERGVNVKHVGLKDSLIYGGIECGKHGHLGANGSRGSIGEHEKSYIASTTGHSHTAGIKGSAWVIGTSTGIGKDAPSYAKGASSWTQTACLNYETGHRQLISSVYYTWRMK
jgi:hypothetical protein